jgi:hypothetical protein
VGGVAGSARLSPQSLGRLNAMKHSTSILLLALLALPAFIDARMIFEAIKVYTSEGVDRIQSDVRLAYNIQYQSIGAGILSLLGLHFCSVLGIKARHPLHIGFVVTTLLTLVILFISRFIAAKYVI